MVCVCTKYVFVRLTLYMANKWVYRNLLTHTFHHNPHIFIQMYDSVYILQIFVILCKTYNTDLDFVVNHILFLWVKNGKWISMLGKRTYFFSVPMDIYKKRMIQYYYGFKQWSSGHAETNNCLINGFTFNFYIVSSVCFLRFVETYISHDNKKLVINCFKPKVINKENIWTKDMYKLN